jgi:hypothetical protein
MLQQVLLDVQSLLEGTGSITSPALRLDTLTAAAELAAALAQSLNEGQLTALPMLATLQVGVL